MITPPPARWKCILVFSVLNFGRLDISRNNKFVLTDLLTQVMFYWIRWSVLSLSYLYCCDLKVVATQFNYPQVCSIIIKTNKQYVASLNIDLTLSFHHKLIIVIAYTMDSNYKAVNIPFRCFVLVGTSFLLGSSWLTGKVFFRYFRIFNKNK